MLNTSVMHVGIIKTELQSRGVRLPFEEKGRKGGAGPAEGITLLLNNRKASIPTYGDYVHRSPYSVERTNGNLLLLKNGEAILPVTLPPPPAYYKFKTEEGIPYKKIALVHGDDCLASTVYQDCIYWNSDSRCKFCGIKLSLQQKTTIGSKTAHQLAEVAGKALELDHICHITLTTGTPNSFDKGIKYLAACTKAIKEKTSLPVHVQFEPPAELTCLDALYESGVDTVGVHIESFDVGVLSSVAPAKAKIGFDTYKKTWKRAVEIFGRNQVSSFIIVGLGEKFSTVIEGSELLAAMGVYPFIVPFRPIPHSRLENVVPPQPQELILMYKETAKILTLYNLSAQKSKAGCVRCGACSALPEFEINE